MYVFAPLNNSFQHLSVHAVQASIYMYIVARSYQYPKGGSGGFLRHDSVRVASLQVVSSSVFASYIFKKQVFMHARN